MYNYTQIIIELLNSPAGVAIITAIVAPALLWLFKIIRTKLLTYKLKKKTENYKSRLRAISSIYSSMRGLVKTVKNVDRVLLLEISNGGHQPLPGSIMYARALHTESSDEHTMGDSDILKLYDEIRLDDYYIKLCVDTIEQKKVTIDVKEQNESLIKSYHTREKLHYVEMHHIYTDIAAQKTFILSIATDDVEDKFKNRGVRAIIDTEVYEIKAEFMKYRN